jgi:hypothetical protein
MANMEFKYFVAIAVVALIAFTVLVGFLLRQWKSGSAVEAGTWDRPRECEAQLSSVRQESADLKSALAVEREKTSRLTEAGAI